MAERGESQEVVVVEGGGASGVKWFMIGALVGAGLGLLLAPQSGERTRRNLTKRARKLRNQAEEKLGELVETVEDRGRQVRETVDEWVEEVADEVQTRGRKAEATVHGAREELERRLSRARARRRTVVAADGVADDDDDLEDADD